MGDRTARGYWFPLALLGFGLLGLFCLDSIRASVAIPNAPGSSNPMAVKATVPAPGGQNESALLLAYYPMRDWSWAVLITVTLVATVAWYGRLARRAGGSVRTYVALAVTGGIALPVGYVVAGLAAASDDPAELVTSVGWPLIGLGALGAAWAHLRLGPGRQAAALIGGGCALVGAATMVGAWSPGLLDPLISAGGLLILALLERSRLLAVVAIAVLLTMVVFTADPLSTLLPAAVLLAAAIVALVRQRGTAESA